MTDDVVRAAAELAEQLSETLDYGQCVSYLDVLDALASAGLTLTPDEGKEVSKAYGYAAEMEGLWVRS